MFVAQTCIKLLRVTIFCLLIIPVFPGVSQVFLEEGFESGVRPDGWTEEYVSGTEPWRFRNGGHSPNDNNWLVPAGQKDITRNPPAAAEGIYNAIFFKQGDNNERTILATPELNLLGGADIELSFFLCQVPWTFEGSAGWDVLRVYYKVSQDSPWILLHEYLDPIYTWTQQTLILPSVSSSYYIGFEGQTRWGYGTCLDNIKVESKGLMPYWIQDISFQQLFTKSVPSGSADVPLMRIDFTVLGNSGNALLQNIKFNSINTSDSDISENGVKLYSTTTQKFSTEHPLGAPVNFVSGIADFINLNHSLPPGRSYVWLTCDISKTATHGNILDVIIASNGILANDTLYPSVEVSPEGYRIIHGTRYFENFEAAHGWTLEGEFEVDSPSGGGGSPGNPDPVSAYSGLKVLGTDLSGTGENPYNYENDLGESTSYHAVSPSVDLLYYKNINLFFQRHFNIEVWDKSSVQVSTDDGSSWNEIWRNNSYINDFQWVQQQIPVPDEYWRTAGLRIRFQLGPTDAQNSYSGLNIDDIYITGEFITKDAGISELIYPLSGPGHSPTDSITVRIKNFGGAEITDPVPVSFSLDGGVTWVTEIFSGKIHAGGSVVYTFTTSADLSVPGPMNVIVKTGLAGDQSPENDYLSHNLYIIPTIKPPYKEDFELNDGYWTKSGNGIWEHGVPAGNIINSASSGNKSWVTGLNSTYGDLITRKSRIIFTDDFESDAGWIYSGEFERGIPDYEHLPYFASSGYYCIGTDLSGRGANAFQYERSVSANITYAATSPSFDTRNFSNLTIGFNSWITIQDGDSIKLEVSKDNGASWQVIWKNSEGPIIEDCYIYREFLLNAGFNNSPELRVRFSLLSSSGSDPVAQGWSIDDFSLTGDLVNSDEACLISPVFDLSGISNPIFETSLWYDTEKGADGVTLQYSVDNCLSWNTISDSSPLDPYWNWYSGKYVSAPGSDGWSGNSNGWITARHLLPSALSDNPSVQFRLKFRADLVNNNYDGIAVDDIRIIDAPNDLGLLEIVNPSSACEIGSGQSLTLRLINNSIKIIKAGQPVSVGYNILHSGNLQNAVETIFTPGDVSPGEIFDIMMSEEFDFSQAGEYKVDVFIVGEEPLFYNDVTNDTIHRLIIVNKPFVELGPDLSTTRPDQVILNAYSGVKGYSYLWQDGSVDSIYRPMGPGIYHVSVSDPGTGCIAHDTIVIDRLVADIGIDGLLTPYSACSWGEQEDIKLRVRNEGTYTIKAGDTITFSVHINSAVYRDVYISSGEVMPGDTLNYTFPGSYDFSVPGIYRLEIVATFSEDYNPANDTLTYSLAVYGNPEINLGNDLESTAPELILEAPPGFMSYEWQDGSSAGSFVVKQPGKNLYYVNVTDENGCKDTDSISVTLNLTDIAVSRIISPTVTSCESSDSINISVRLRNTGNLPLQAGQLIMLDYVFEGGSASESYTLPGMLMPYDSIDLVFRQKAKVVKGTLYNFRVAAEFDGDMLSSNNSLIIPVRVYSPPVPYLGSDYRVVAAMDYQLDAGSDYLSYLWSDGSTGKTMTINAPGINQCSVIVTDLNGCTAADTTWIMLAVPDIRITAINIPGNSCTSEKPGHIQVSIANSGNWDIDKTATIFASYTLDGQPEVKERIILNTDFMKNSDLVYTFNKEEVFNVAGQYTVLASVTYESDLVPENNFIDSEFKLNESPAIDVWNSDTLSIAGPITLSAPQGYSSYRWQDGSQENIFDVNQPTAELYSVTVTDVNGCKSSDSVFVIYDLPDIGITRILTPSNYCGDGMPGSKTISLEIINNGCLAVPGNRGIKLSYSIDGGIPHLKTIFLSSPLLPSQKRVVNFETDYLFPAAGNFRLHINIEDEDSNLENNRAGSSFTISEKLTLKISEQDTLKNVKLPFRLDAGSGFPSYTWQDGSRNSSFEVKTEGFYHVSVIDINGCSASDSVYVYTLGENEFPGDIRIYPVPVSDVLHLCIQMNASGSIEIEFFNFNSILYKEKFNDIQNVLKDIEVTKYPPGVYFLRIKAGEYHQTKKVILY